MLLYVISHSCYLFCLVVLVFLFILFRSFPPIHSFIFVLFPPSPIRNIKHYRININAILFNNGRWWTTCLPTRRITISSTYIIISNPPFLWPIRKNMATAAAAAAARCCSTCCSLTASSSSSSLLLLLLLLLLFMVTSLLSVL